MSVKDVSLTEFLNIYYSRRVNKKCKKERIWDNKAKKYIYSSEIDRDNKNK